MGTGQDEGRRKGMQTDAAIGGSGKEERMRRKRPLYNNATCEERSLAVEEQAVEVVVKTGRGGEGGWDGMGWDGMGTDVKQGPTQPSRSNGKAPTGLTGVPGRRTLLCTEGSAGWDPLARRRRTTDIGRASRSPAMFWQKPFSSILGVFCRPGPFHDCHAGSSRGGGEDPEGPALAGVGNTVSPCSIISSPGAVVGGLAGPGRPTWGEAL
jgi:hypothetical protein